MPSVSKEPKEGLGVDQSGEEEEGARGRKRKRCEEGPAAPSPLTIDEDGEEEREKGRRLTERAGRRNSTRINLEGTRDEKRDEEEEEEEENGGGAGFECRCRQDK